MDYISAFEQIKNNTFTEIGCDYPRKFLKGFVFCVSLVIIPLVLLFGSIGVMNFFKVSDVTSQKIGIGIIIFLIFPYLPWAFWAFFHYTKKFLTFKPFENTVPSDMGVLMNTIKNFFEAPKKNNKNIFSVSEKGNKLWITWSTDVLVHQLLAVERISIKRIFILTFNKKTKTIKVVQRDIDISWSLGFSSFMAHLNFFQGVSMEYEREFIPSLKVAANGSVILDAQSIRYNSNEIIKPLLYLAAKNGWIVQFAII